MDIGWVREQAGFDCAGFSEIDKYAIRIYKRHFPTHRNYGDATLITAEELPDFDLLCGGFPCQAFSIAGKRRGFKDTRGTLFFEICRIARAKRPGLLLLENVRGLLSHDEGRTFLVILQSLDELGYDLQWQVLNSKNYGVPQNRERVFIVGHLRGTPRPEVFPIQESHRNVNEGGAESRTGIWAFVLDSNYYKGADGKRTMIVANTVTPDTYLARGERKRVDGKAVLTSMCERRIRRLTPTECERLQGFPDGWTEGVSDTQRYKCLGNAVTVNVVQAIAERLLDKAREL